MRTMPLFLAVLAAISTSAAATTQERIGGWVLACGNAEACILRLDKRFLDKAGITGDLEVQALGKTLVPVLTLRGLSNEMLLAAATAGRAEASLRFNDGPRQDLVCSAASTVFFCAPHDSAARTLAADLPTARSVTVRVSVTITGVNPLPAQERSLDLSGSAEALARLRVLGPTQVPAFSLPQSGSGSPAGLLAMADRMMKAAGYPNGVADLQAMLGRYLKK